MKYVRAETVMYGVLILATVWLTVAVLRRNRDPLSRINIEDLLLGEDGRVSKAAVVMLGAFMLTSWQMIYFTAAGKMTEGYMGLYMAAWVGPTLAKLFNQPSEKKNAEPSSTTVPPPSAST
jgi:hypothetical protein